jgi:alanine racemase
MTKKEQFVGRPVWAEISLPAIQQNLRAIRRHVGDDRKILAIVKANAYGHGAVPVAKAASKAGADWLGVTCTNEGLELRESGARTRILVLSSFWPGEEQAILKNNLTPAITRLEQLQQLERAARRAFRGQRKPYPIHLKIDTGMTRLGIAMDEIDRFAGELAACKHLRLEGTFTHFASSEDFSIEQTESQEKNFAAAIARLRELGVNPGIVHLANSAAVAMRPSTWADMVRPGALIYGYHQFYEPAG